MKNLVERSKVVLSPVLGRYFPDFEVAYGKDCYLYGVDGKAYLDFTSGIGVTSTGHCHKKVVKAIHDQAASLIHACIGIAHYESPIKLAEMLQDVFGSTPIQCFFAQSGGEAIEASIKLAKYVKQKPLIMGVQGGFHGRSMGALSLTTSKKKYREGYEPFLASANVEFPYPRCYRCPFDKSIDTCQFFCADKFETFFKQFAAQVSAIIFEPVLGEGGYVPAPKPFLQKMRALCDEHQVLLILDEVQSGIGRTGKWFAYEHYDIVPDIIAIAKGIASGMPLGVCVAKREIMSLWKPGTHGGTFGGNPVTCAAGVATLTVLTECLPQVDSMGARVMAQLKQELAGHPAVGEIRGLGLMIGIEFVKDLKDKTAYPELVSNIMNQCLEKGLIVISCGIEENVIRIIPALTISQDHLDQGMAILIDVINTYR